MKRDAFTLLELLLAITLMSVTVGAAYALMRSGFQARRVAEDAAGQTRRVVLAMDQVLRSLRSAVPPGATLAGTFVGDDSTGWNSDAVTFNATEDAYGTTWGDVVKLEYRLEGSSDADLRLVRTRWRNLLSSRALEGEGEVLCRAVKAFGLRYFDGETWYDSWDSSRQGNTLPTAVEVTLEVYNSESPTGDQLDQTASMQRVVLIPCQAEAVSR
jgi:type II secretion system protein J